VDTRGGLDEIQAGTDPKAQEGKVQKFTVADLESKAPHELVSAKVAEFAGGRKAMIIDCKKGFQWTACLKEKMGTDFCQATHFGYLKQGKMVVSIGDMETGKQTEINEGDTYFIPPNHDARAEEDCIMMEFNAATVEMYKDVK